MHAIVCFVLVAFTPFAFAGLRLDSFAPTDPIGRVVRLRADASSRLELGNLTIVRQLAALRERELVAILGRSADQYPSLFELVRDGAPRLEASPFRDFPMAARLALAQAGVSEVTDLNADWLRASRKHGGRHDHAVVIDRLAELVRARGLVLPATRALDRSIEDVGLTVRVQSVFLAEGLRTLREASLYTEAELRRVPGLGIGTLGTVRTLIEAGLVRIGTSPFVELVKEDRVALARLGVWTLDDLVSQWSEVAQSKLFEREKPRLSSFYALARAAEAPPSPGSAASTNQQPASINPNDHIAKHARGRAVYTQTLWDQNVKTIRQLAALRPAEYETILGPYGEDRTAVLALVPRAGLSYGASVLPELTLGGRLTLAGARIVNFADLDHRPWAAYSRGTPAHEPTIATLSRVVRERGIVLEKVRRLDVSIAEVPMPRRTRLALLHADLQTLREASLLSVSELKALWGINSHGVSELKDLVEEGLITLDASPFRYLEWVDRLRLARLGVWTASDLFEKWSEVQDDEVFERGRDELQMVFDAYTANPRPKETGVPSAAAALATISAGLESLEVLAKTKTFAADIQDLVDARAQIARIRAAQSALDACERALGLDTSTAETSRDD